MTSTLVKEHFDIVARIISAATTFKDRGPGRSFCIILRCAGDPRRST